MRLSFLILFSALAMVAQDSRQQLPTADEVVAKVMERDDQRQASLHGYTAIRRYVLENQHHHKRADMLVKMICREDGSKYFETVSETGGGGARRYVFPTLPEVKAKHLCQMRANVKHCSTELLVWGRRVGIATRIGNTLLNDALRSEGCRLHFYAAVQPASHARIVIRCCVRRSHRRRSEDSEDRNIIPLLKVLGDGIVTRREIFHC
jgi:hypothetical protein